MKDLICILICILLTACHKKEYTEVKLRQPDDINCIYLPVSVNGKNGFFLFDTGTTRTSINADWAEGLGIKITDSADVSIGMIYGVKKQKVSEKIDIQIGDITTSQICFIDKDFLYEQVGFDGVIGMDIISRYYWYFDLVNHQVKIAKQSINQRVDTTYPPFRQVYTLSLGNTPVFPVTIHDSLSVNLLFDTGHSVNKLNINGVQMPAEFTLDLSNSEHDLYRKLNNQPAPDNTNVYIDNQFTGIYHKQLTINNKCTFPQAFIGIKVHDYFQRLNDEGICGKMGIWFVRRFSTMYIDPFAQEVEFAISSQDTTRYRGVQGFESYRDECGKVFFVKTGNLQKDGCKR